MSNSVVSRDLYTERISGITFYVVQCSPFLNNVNYPNESRLERYLHYVHLTLYCSSYLFRKISARKAVIRCSERICYVCWTAVGETFECVIFRYSVRTNPQHNKENTQNTHLLKTNLMAHANTAWLTRPS